MTNDGNPVRVGYLQSSCIEGRSEGVVKSGVEFRLLVNHAHDSCRGNVVIPAGALMSVSELYGGIAYLLEGRRPGAVDRKEDILLCKLWRSGDGDNRFYGTVYPSCYMGSIQIPAGTGFTLYRNPRDFGLTVNRLPGR